MDSFIGHSPAAADLLRSIRKAARVDLNVLLLGESGTGKGVAARMIHRLSRRDGQRFVVVNCGAIPDSLMESELFGYERGAFTGADRRKKGKFELADKGTIFLDEIGELPLAGQARLLHVLQEREIERLGGESHPIGIDVRVLAATNRDLAMMVRSGTFRQDLFFRLHVLPIRIPPLRERREDIPLLVAHFTLKFGVQTGLQATRLSTDALEAMLRYDWPGNVRELENVMLHAIAMSDGDELQMRDLPPDVRNVPRTAPAKEIRNFYAALHETAREVCVEALEANGGNCTMAAHSVGLHRNSLYRLVRKHNLDHLLERVKSAR